MSEQLKSLLERVEATEGPDINIDVLIWWEFFAPENGKRDAALKLREGDDLSRAFWARQYYGEHRGTKWTASVDAALALVEKVLPDAGLSFGNGGWGCFAKSEKWYASVRYGDDANDVQLVQCRTLPLALIAALLKALPALPSQQGGG